MANSRVGARIKARGRAGLDAPEPARRAMIGKPKVKVLPEPVGPRPRMSFPAKASGIAASWIGNGEVIPCFERTETMGRGKPRSAKVVIAHQFSRRYCLKVNPSESESGLPTTRC